MSETFDADFGEPPEYASKSGGGRVPKDIWEAACSIVKSFRDVDDAGHLPVDPDDFLRTLIAMRLIQEREGWGRDIRN